MKNRTYLCRKNNVMEQMLYKEKFSLFGHEYRNNHGGVALKIKAFAPTIVTYVEHIFGLRDFAALDFAQKSAYLVPTKRKIYSTMWEHRKIFKLSKDIKFVYCDSDFGVSPKWEDHVKRLPEELNKLNTKRQKGVI